MKQFILRVFIFTVILSSILFLIKLTVPFYWGNHFLSEKIDFLIENQEEFDCLFIGSSHTYRHINPILFDSITKKTSFNLGCPGMGYLESHFIVENYLKKYKTSDDLDIFFQKLKPWNIKNENLHTVRAKYFLDLKRLIMGVRYFGSSKNYNQVYNHILSYVENKLCIGELAKIFTYNFTSRSQFVGVPFDQKGYYACDQEYEVEKSTSLKKRNNRYKKSIRNKKKRIIPKRKQKVKIVSLAPLNMNMEEIPPNVNLFKINEIILEPEFHFDKGHLNSNGADLYTKKIANVFLKKYLIK